MQVRFFSSLICPAIAAVAVGFGGVAEFSRAGEPSPASFSEVAPDAVGRVGDQSPIPVNGGKAKLTPANSKVMFVGIHTGAKPDPRTCGFGDFSGEATFSADGKTLTGVVLEMKVDSLYTFNDNLTQHLKSGDFFDAREYPTAKFVSSKVEIGADGKGTVTGMLTLMKVSEEVKIPVNMSQGEAGFTLQGEVKIDRSKFGMDKMTEKVSKEVTVSFVLGEKTDPSSVLPK
jgi:polyisoprenoid-binding protein YceI